MTTKTEIVVARLYDGVQLIHTIALPQGRASEKITLNEVAPSRLQELDFNVPDKVPKSLWRQQSWGAVDYIPLSEWKDEFRLVPEESNLVARPDGDHMVICRYVDYMRVKEF